MKKPRKIPLRTCTGCHEKKDKRSMLRVVRTSENDFLLDPSGKKAGRGAYVCPDKLCLEKIFKSKSLERSLKIDIPPETYAKLKDELENQMGR